MLGGRAADRRVAGCTGAGAGTAAGALLGNALGICILASATRVPYNTRVVAMPRYRSRLCSRCEAFELVWVVLQVSTYMATRVSSSTNDPVCAGG